MATNIDTFRLKLAPEHDYDFNVDWGDGKGQKFVGVTSSIISQAGITHEYLIPGVYSVKVTENVPGGFPSIFYGEENGTVSDGLKITNIS